ncbi:hypothetical protein MHYP_G00252840 [Metynnis hypsauchen]
MVLSEFLTEFLCAFQVAIVAVVVWAVGAEGWTVDTLAWADPEACEEAGEVKEASGAAEGWTEEDSEEAEADPLWTVGAGGEWAPQERWMGGTTVRSAETGPTEAPPAPAARSPCKGVYF